MPLGISVRCGVAERTTQRLLGDASDFGLGVGRTSLSQRNSDRSEAIYGVSSRRAPIQSFLFGAGLAFVGLAGGFAGYVHLAGTASDAVSVSERLAALDDETTASLKADLDALDVADFTERFGFSDTSNIAKTGVAKNSVSKTSVAKASAPATAAKKNVYVALLDPTYSLGYSPSTFAIRNAPTAAPVLAKAETKTGTSKAEDALLTRTPTQLALSVPVPPTKPSDLRVAPTSKSAYGHDALVQRARLALAHAKPSSASFFDKLFGDAPPAKTVLAYAGSDGGILSDGSDSAAAKPGLYDNTTAVYDISKRTVYMPNGTKLEAHSGLGQHLDNPAYAHLRMRGVTPPHIYDLKPREALFHGVAALRLTPVGGEGAIYGRSGLLAHTYMLGPNGDSNGCVSFKDYNKFLQAYRNGEVKRLIVVASMD